MRDHSPSYHMTGGHRPLNGHLRVLVTEDNVALRRFMIDVLAWEGYRVVEAANAFEMTETILRSSEPRSGADSLDLVVSDICMPGKSGLEALSELRRRGVTVPFLFVTCFPDLVAYEDVARLDARLLAKPFTLNELRMAAATLVHPRVFERRIQA